MADLKDARALLRTLARAGGETGSAVATVLAVLDEREKADDLDAAEAVVRGATTDPRIGKALRVVLAEYDRRGTELAAQTTEEKP